MTYLLSFISPSNLSPFLKVYFDFPLLLYYLIINFILHLKDKIV